MGKAAVTYRLRDWLISRQRYWGAPIPIVYCPEHGMVPVPEDQLPVLLPDDVRVPADGRVAAALRAGVREHDLPEVRRSGGARDRHDGHLHLFVVVLPALCRPAQRRRRPGRRRRWRTGCRWTSTSAAPEHASMHLLYARFFVKALHDMGLLNFDEPFTRLFHQGMMLGPDGQKMSKSRGNVVAPDDAGRALRRRHRALLPDVHGAVRPGRPVEQAGHRGRLRAS